MSVLPGGHPAPGWLPRGQRNALPSVKRDNRLMTRPLRYPIPTADSTFNSMSARALDLHFESDSFTIRLSDGQELTVPLTWFPTLLHAAPEQRERFRISPSGQGLHWPDLDEDISVSGLVAARADQTSRHRR